MGNTQNECCTTNRQQNNSELGSHSYPMDTPIDPLQTENTTETKNIPHTSGPQQINNLNTSRQLQQISSDKRKVSLKEIPKHILDLKTRGPNSDRAFLVEAFQSHKLSPLVQKLYETEGKYDAQDIDKSLEEKVIGTVPFKHTVHTETNMDFMDPLMQLQVQKKTKSLGPYRYVEESGDYWGDYFLNKRHGFGRLVYSNGSIYEGSFFNDHLTGCGRFMDTNGIVYQGGWKDGDFFQEGVLKKLSKKDKETYGDYVLEKRCKENLNYQYVYTGAWENGKRNGPGVEETSDDIYTGNFINDVRIDDKGKLFNKINGSTYYGPFNDEGIIEGFGEMHLEDGGKYTGAFQQNLFNGRGVQLDSKKLRYEGQFKDGLKCGIGEQECEDGTWIKGKWTKGDRLEDGCLYESDRKTIKYVVDKNGVEVEEIEIDIEELKARKKNWFSPTNHNSPFGLTRGSGEDSGLMKKLDYQRQVSRSEFRRNTLNMAGLDLQDKAED